MNHPRGRLTGPLAASLAALLVATCAAPPPTGAPATRPAGSPAPSLAAAPSAGPAGTPAPNATLLPGTRVLASAFSFGAVSWSPDGSAVAAEALDQAAGTGSVEVFSPAGDRLATIPGFDFGWLDGTHLLVFETTPNDQASGTVSEWTTEGRRVLLLPGRYGGVLTNGHGVALLKRAPPQGAYAGTDFQFCANDQLSAMISAPGTPAAWSPDGRLVAVTESATTVLERDGIALASTGGPIMGYLQVLHYPAGSVVRSFRDHPVDLRGGVTWSPDSRYLAAGDFASVGELVFDLVTGAVTTVPVPVSWIEWMPDGRLAITEPDGTTMAWSPTGGLTKLDLAPGYAVWGSTLDDVALLPVDQPPGIAVTLRTRTATVSVPVNTAGRFAVAWAPDGTSCLLATASTLNGAADELLRVSLP